MSSLTAYVSGGYWVYDYAVGDEAVNPITDLQSISPSAVIELFELQLVQALHGSTDVYRFHAGVSLNSYSTVYWNGQSYSRMPIEAEGFEYTGNGQLPQPKVRISNINGTVTALLLIVNGITAGNDLIGAKVVRIRTLARYLDAVNFPGSVNPYGAPDPNVEMPRETYYITQKSIETRDIVEFTLASAFDLQGVRAPKRQCISNICQWIYKGDGCAYTPVASFSGTYSSKSLSATYSQTTTTITVTSTSHGIDAGDQVYLNFTSGTAVSGYYFVDTAATNTFTVTSSVSDTITTENVTVSWLKVTATAHGLTANDAVYLNFTSGTATDGSYTATVVSANSFTVRIQTASTTSGNVTATQWYDENDAPVYVSTQDFCAKRLDSCEARFGSNNPLPFGSYPGIGSFYT